MKTNPVKAIREFCTECCGGSRDAVKACTAQRCALYPFRFGKNPYRAPRVMTDEQRDAARTRLAMARERMVAKEAKHGKEEA